MIKLSTLSQNIKIKCRYHQIILILSQLLNIFESLTKIKHNNLKNSLSLILLYIS